MSTPNPFIKKIKESPGLRLSVLFGSFFFLLIAVSIIINAIDTVPSLNERSRILLSSTLQCLLAFCVPAYLLARFSADKKWATWLEIAKTPKLMALTGVVIVYIVSMPAMEWLIEWNSNIKLPESMSGLETILRNWEETGESATKVLLESNGIFELILGVLVVGIMTGFSEELFFRGGLQGILSRTNMGSAAAVWIAAIIFSTMHFQFFGFIPRLLMGAFFGYLLVWSRCLWIPVFAHALNNSIVVISSALSGNQSQGIMEQTGMSSYLDPEITVISSVVLTVLFLWLGKDIFFKTNQSRWQKNRFPQTSGR